MTAVARSLDCAECTARRLLDRGAIPSTRDSTGRRLVNESDVLAYKRARREQSA
ncbi:helix-turn-helix domain-containing protein [Steroidobacter sp.]|uniref:helix-turn-helix domain-containing protein n=1 Tax=Steroidobacter sp. TaxID=1978227 RepID=UPI0039F4488B